MKFILMVEGYTEKEGLSPLFRKWLNPRLSQPVRIKIDRSEGCDEFIRQAARKAKKHIGDPQNADLIGIIGLLDLYGPQKFYPPEKRIVHDRYRWGKQHFEDQVSDPRFRMFFAVHEVEAWLLSDPSLFAPEVARAFPGKIRQPEEVNFDEHPSILINKIYRERLHAEYKKRAKGRELLEKLDPNLVYARCPYFAQMLDEMLRMAKDAGL